MSNILIKQMPIFKRVYKKLQKNIKIEVDIAIKQIIENPKIGEQKKGDLSDVFVYKFKVNRQEYLLAYKWDATHRLLLCLGVHENFYRDLKR